MIELKNFKDVLEMFQNKNTALETYYDINYNISKFLVDYRIANSMTQKDLAKKLNVSQVMVSKYENGEYNFTLKKLCEISEILGAKLSLEMMEEKGDTFDTLWNIGENKLEDNKQWLIA